MKFSIRMLFGLVLIYFSYQAIRIELGGYEIGLLSWVNMFPFALVVMLTTVTLLADTSYFKIDRKIYQYTFSGIGLLACLIVLAKMFHRNYIEDSKTVMKLVNKAGADNVWQFDFKDGRYFTLKEYSLMGQVIYYGKYKKQGNTLHIIESNYDGQATTLSRTGIIRRDTVYWVGSDTMIIEKE